MHGQIFGQDRIGGVLKIKCKPATAAKEAASYPSPALILHFIQQCHTLY